MSARRPRRRALSRTVATIAATGTLLSAIALSSGCNDGSDAGAGGPEVQGVGEQRGGSSAALAQCADWQQGTRAERYQTIEDLRGQLTAQTSESEDTGYPDEDAYALFERVCKQPYASAYRLYKVYGQAAAFEPLRPQE